MVIQTPSPSSSSSNVQARESTATSSSQSGTLPVNFLFLAFPLEVLSLAGSSHFLRSALLLFSLPLGGCLRSLLDSSLRQKKDIAEEDQQLRLEDELAIFPVLLLAPSL